MPAALVKQIPAPADPEPAIPIEVEELPPESKPSGIGQKYVPKDEGAPPVILGEDVRAAEYGATTSTEAEHRTRRAPTIAKMRAIDLPLPPASEPDFAQPKRRGTGLVALLAVLVVVGGAGAAALLVRRGAGETATQARPEPPAPVATVTADTAAPKPPEPVAAAAPTPTTTPPDAVPMGSPEPGASGPAAVADKGSEPPASAPAAKAAAKVNAKAAAAQKVAAASPKPAPAAKTPPPTPTPKPAKPAGGSRQGTGSSKAAIVRDSPF
jgi:hypothetical protein